MSKRYEGEEEYRPRREKKDRHHSEWGDQSRDRRKPDRSKERERKRQYS